MSVRPLHTTPGTLHRLRPSQEWRPVEIVSAAPHGQFLVQEADRPLPGRFLAFRSDLRQIAGIFTYREPFAT